MTLDIFMFPTQIYFERPETPYFAMWQILHRVWHADSLSAIYK